MNDYILNSKNNKIAIIIGLIVVLALAITSSYAYFSISQTNNATAATIVGASKTTGNVTLSTQISKLYLNLGTLSMSQDNVGKLYYANSNSSGTPITSASDGTGIYTLATATVGSGETTYNCTYNFDVSAILSKAITDGTDLDIKVTFEGDSIDNYIKTYTLKDLVSGTKTLTGTFYNVKYGSPQTIKYYSTVENTNKTQNNFQGNSYSVSINSKSGTNGFKCKITDAVDYALTKQPELYTAMANGKYRIELWEARAGSNGVISYGGYTRGDIELTKGEALYFYVGEYPTYTAGSCYGTNPNNSYNACETGSCYGGGGATDVRLVSGVWNTALSLNSRIMVAGGSGGKNYNGNGGAGGGLTGYDGVGKGSDASYYPGTGGTQISGYQFGVSGRSTTIGGGGYYGGNGGYGGNAGGGSSYISGHTGCIAILNSSLTNNPRTVRNNSSGSACTPGTTDNLCSVHYSNKVFTNTKMIDGNGYVWTTVKDGQERIPNPNGGLFELGKGLNGDGHARITYIS